VADEIEIDCMFWKFGLDSRLGRYFDPELDQLTEARFGRMVETVSTAFLAPPRESRG
jgi:hypothetical protein